MTCTKSLLCPECWEEVDATYEIRHHVEQVRGVTVEADDQRFIDDIMLQVDLSLIHI